MKLLRRSGSLLFIGISGSPNLTSLASSALPVLEPHTANAFGPLGVLHGLLIPLAFIDLSFSAYLLRIRLTGGVKR